VLGGNAHEFVVEFLGVLAGADGQAYHRVLIHSDQASGLTDAATLLQVRKDREGFVLGEFGPIQGRAFALGEAFLAVPTGQHAALLVGAVAEADTQVTQAAPAVVGALGVLAAEIVQVVHGASRRSSQAEKVVDSLHSP